jgi:hypothetical protein
MIAVKMTDGSLIPCQDEGEAKMLGAAEHAFYYNETPPPEVIGVLDRAGLNASNSSFYRAMLHKLGA